MIGWGRQARGQGGGPRLWPRSVPTGRLSFRLLGCRSDQWRIVSLHLARWSPSNPLLCDPEFSPRVAWEPQHPHPRPVKKNVSWKGVRRGKGWGTALPAPDTASPGAQAWKRGSGRTRREGQTGHLTALANHRAQNHGQPADPQTRRPEGNTPQLRRRLPQNSEPESGQASDPSWSAGVRAAEKQLRSPRDAEGGSRLRFSGPTQNEPET